MATLADLQQKKFSTIKAFAEAYGVSPSTASIILKGKHHRTFTRNDIQRLADIFGVSFQECVMAADETFACYHQGNPSLMAAWKLETRWQKEERFQEDFRQWQAKGGKDRIIFAIEAIGIFEPFGLTSNATEADIKRAFREKVKAMADGNGGYNGDMDKLVQAKEKAIAFVQGRK